MTKKTRKGEKRPVTKKIVSLSLDIELMECIQDIAKREKRSLSFVVERCLLDWLEWSNDQSNQPPLAPHEDVEKMLEFFVGPTVMNNLKFFSVRATSLFMDHTGINIKLVAKSRGAGPEEPWKPVEGGIRIITNPGGEYSAQFTGMLDTVLV